MKMQNAGILAGLLATSALALSPTSFAQTTTTTETTITVETAPPAAKPSPPPTPTKVGYMWSPGYWNWDGTAYAWTDGEWVAVVQEKKWVAPAWKQKGKKWYFTPGHWK